MHRYNMAHRGAEERVFPAALAAEVPVIAFTATRWGTLLEGHAAWRGAVPGAVDCYRFALAQAAVRVVLAAPHSVEEAREDVRALAAPPPTPEELAAWRRYGDLVHGDGRSEFETAWP
jgi:aryl-alcohol dehydrogenase-like predicted oxidoreductase